MISNKNTKIILFHPYHLVDSSPQPFCLAICILQLAINFVFYMHKFSNIGFFVIISFFTLIFVLFEQWNDVIIEATFEGMHTLPVQKNLKFGVILFIISEVMFFVGFFWAYFHSSLAPTIQIGSIQPPVGINIIYPFGIPLLNTFILLTSGLTLTIAHHAIISTYQNLSIKAVSITIIYAFIFIIEQFFEYLNASFNINDGIYGSTFYMLTGFHGFHVIIGTIFIFVCLIRLYFGHFTFDHHLGFEAAAQYQHFVDVVWLYLFICIYQQSY